MTIITDEMVDAALWAAANESLAWRGLPTKPADEGLLYPDMWRAQARAAISAVAPLIAAAEREACEKIADAAAASGRKFGREDIVFGANLVAAAIHARSS